MNMELIATHACKDQNIGVHGNLFGGVLGLSERRYDKLVSVSDSYIRKDWRSNPIPLYGIGKYGSDVYKIVCLGH